MASAVQFAVYRAVSPSLLLSLLPLDDHAGEEKPRGDDEGRKEQERGAARAGEEEDYRTTKEMGSAEREGAGGGAEAEGVRENGGMKQQEGIGKLVVGVCVMEKKVREQDEEEEEEEEEEKEGS